jgi:hypothetical protein
MPILQRIPRAVSRARLARAFVTVGLVGGVLVSGRGAYAQSAQPVALTGKLQGGIHLQVTEPKGDFGKNTGNGFGVSAVGLWRLDDSGIANLRGDLSIVTYGTNTRRIDLANTGGLVKLDLRTTSNIFSMVVGPQIGGTAGPFSPYVAALGGFSVFWTESSVEGSNNTEAFASTTNASDAVLAYGGAAGATVRVYNGPRPVRLDLGARLLRHDDVRYLNKERIREAFENDRDPVPIRSRADFVTYYLGVNIVAY